MGKIATDFLNEWNKSLSLKIKRAVLEAHKEGSFGNCGNVEINTSNGDVHVTVFPDACSSQMGCKTIYSNQDAWWDDGLEFHISDNMYIFSKDELRNKSVGKQLTEKQKEEAPELKGELVALTELEAYAEAIWEVILEEDIEEAITQYVKIMEEEGVPQ